MTLVEIVVPVYNEEKQLEESFSTLADYTKSPECAPYRITLTIADNASTDSTPRIGRALEKREKNIKYLRIDKKGRGEALLTAWKGSQAQILAYMDVDLSSDLSSLVKLLQAISQGADIAIGSRLAKGARVEGRTLVREVMSRGYNLLIRLLFRVEFKDAQCGFKAISKRAFRALAPLIQNRNWFFDSEMLIIASRAGMKIVEVPISWKDDPTSTVKIAKTAKEDILGLLSLIRTQPWNDIRKKSKRS